MKISKSPDSLEQVFENSARQQQQVEQVSIYGYFDHRVSPENDILYGESIRKDEQGPELLDGQRRPVILIRST